MKLGVARALVNGRIVAGDVAVEDGVVTEIGLPPGGRALAVPGFVDLQVNGVAAIDFVTAAAEDYAAAGAALARSGVTAYLPTLVSVPEEDMVRALRNLAAAEVGAGEARPLGMHVEGPFLSVAGAHEPAALRRPDSRLVARALDAGPITMWTLAPELAGSGEIIELLRAAGVTVACGHTAADAVAAHAAFDRGAVMATHLFNAMGPFHHRNPGIAGAALARSDVIVSVIADGRHLASETVRLVYAACRGRVALITDRTADGSLGGRHVEPDVLTGGTAPMDEAVRNLVDLGIPLEDALASAAAIPATAIGRPHLGRLHPGARADVAVLDEDLRVVRTLVGGVGAG